MKVILRSPPPAKMNLEALWNVTLINSGKARPVQLYGIAHDGAGHFVADGLTSVFTLPAGLTVVNAPELEPIDYHSNPGYDDIVKRTNAVPSGVYNICVYVLDAKNTKDTIGRDCISNHVVLNVTPPQLLHPNNNGSIREHLPLFSWTPVSPLVPVNEVSYKLRIVEVVGQQSAFDAIQSNPEWFAEDDLPVPLCPYPLSANALEPGTKYAWQVIVYANTLDAGRGELCRSEAWMFTVEGNKSDSISDAGIVQPTDTVNPDLSHNQATKGGNVDSLTHPPGQGVAASGVHPVPSKPAPVPPFEVVTKPAGGICSGLKTNFKSITNGDTVLYALSVTNTPPSGEDSTRQEPGTSSIRPRPALSQTNASSGGADSLINHPRPVNKPFPPRIFRITVSGDSVVGIMGGLSDSWKRTPSKFPPGSSVMQWTASSDAFPTGKSELGSIKFRKSGESSRMIHYEWLDRDSNVLCRDSTALGESSSYYELNDEPSNVVIEVPNTVLHVQYLNNYASSNALTISIFDAESQTQLSSKAKVEVGAYSTNGLNRVTVSLKDYELVPGKGYILNVMGSKSTQSLNFRVMQNKVTNDREK